VATPDEFKGAAGMNSFTAVYFNRAHTLAMTQIGMFCGSTCGNWGTAILEKKNGKWEIVWSSAPVISAVLMLGAKANLSAAVLGPPLLRCYRAAGYQDRNRAVWYGLSGFAISSYVRFARPNQSRKRNNRQRVRRNQNEMLIN
jgi:hypothetical protein